MNVFSNVQLNASVLPYTNTTLAKTTNSITVTNFSHLNLSVGSSVTPGYGVMPPFSTQSFSVTPNEQITWQMQDASVPPASQANEYVSYTESVLHYASGLQMLAQLPLYDITVNGALNITSGTVDATITNATLDVNVPNGVQINNNSLNVVTGAGSQTTVANTVDINMTGSTVTQKSNVINDYVASSNIINWGTFTTTLNLASGATYEFTFNNNNTSALIDKIYCVLNDPNYNIANLELTVFVMTDWHVAYAMTNIADTVLQSQYGNVTNNYVIYPTTPIVANGFVGQIKNIGTTTNTDTVTLYAYGHYASSEVINDTSSPVNTQGVQGSPTASGITNLSSANSYVVTFPALANLVATKIIVSGQWQGTATAGSSNLSISTGGNTIATYPLTGVLADDYFPPINLDLGQGITLSSDGVAIQETGALSDMQVEVFVVLK